MSSITEILKTALQHEVKASVLYNSAADITEDDESRMLFLELSGFEDDHARRLIEGAKEYPDVDATALATYLREVEGEAEGNLTIEESQVIKRGDMRAILKMAIEFEQSAKAAYQRLAGAAQEGPFREFCETMIQEEQSHADTLTQELHSLDMDLEDRPGL